jgi:hypothetical protein
MNRVIALGLLMTPVLAPLPAMAENLRCQTQGYCILDLTCAPDDEFFVLTDSGKSTPTFGWEGSATFSAEAQRKDGMTVYQSNTLPDSIQTLVVGDDMTASFSISAMLNDELYTSFQSMTCQRM